MSFILVSDEKIPAVTGGVFLFERQLSSIGPLLTTPAHILAEYIIEQAIGSMTDPDDGLTWPLYISRMSDGITVKTEVGALYDTSGLKDGRLMEGQVIQHYGLQLKIRSSSHSTGWNKADVIANALDEVLNAVITVSGEDYIIQQVSRTGPVISLGAEPGTKERRLFVVNFLVTLKRV